MSRAPPFPSRSQRTNGTSYTQQPQSAPGASIPSTRPLNIGRQGQTEHSTTPVSSYASGSPSYPSTAPLGPSRPQRSELRNRSEYAGSDRTSTASQDPYRDSTGTTRSETMGYRTAPSSSTIPPVNTRQRTMSPVDSSPEQGTPKALNTVLSAFQSAGSRKRQDDDDYYEYQREREREIEAEQERQRRIRERNPGLRTRTNTRTGDIDAVLDKVKDGWEFVIDPKFNNVDLALQLLDQNSQGKDMESFRRTKNMLSKALKGSVDKHYQAFASSLPHHASLLNHLTAAQAEMSAARSALMEAKESLGGKRSDLVQLWNRGQILEEMLKLLDQIEHLKAVPDLLETLMSEKRLLQASILLVRSLKTINKPDMLEIGAVADLRSYLSGQETALREILIDEIQSHIYLKSFWCESRWAAYSPGQEILPKVEFEGEGERPFSEDVITPSSPTSGSTRLRRYLNDLSLRPNDPPYDISEAGNTGTSSSIAPPVVNTSSYHPAPSSLNPEADSFTYMETLLESLAVLGKLGTALDTIAQRLPSELFTLVESTLDEVEERAEFGKRQSLTTSLDAGLSKFQGVYVFRLDDGASINDLRPGKTQLKASVLRLSALESLTMRAEHEILRDLFWTLYSKLDAVAQGLRVVTEVSNRIGSRRDFKDSSGAKPGTLFPLPDLWNHVQTEVRTLIHDYLTDEQRGSTTSRNPISSLNEVLRDGKFNRDRVKPVFRFSDTDTKVVGRLVRPYEDGLSKVLKDTMPGLAPASGVDTAQTIVASNAIDDRLLGSDQHHRLLIRPDAFLVTVLFQPTLAFLSKIADTMPPDVAPLRISSSVLDKFVLAVYLPQLEEKVSDLFHEAVSGQDAFQIDPLSLRFSREPLAKSSTHLMALVNSLCDMLRTSPFHRENYSRLILSVVIQFYQRCSDRFQSLTTTPAATLQEEPHVALAAQWAQRFELQSCLPEIHNLEEDVDSVNRAALFDKETSVEMKLLGEAIVRKEDLISSNRNVSALATLYRSVSWFASELHALRPRAEDPFLVSSPTSDSVLLSPTTPVLPSLLSATDNADLPLSREMSLRFHALLKTYDQLSTLILDTLRLDLRCRTIHHLHASLKEGTYDSSYEAAEPDPYIVDLNLTLMQCNESLSFNIPENQRKYIFSGLGHLMESILIAGATSLRLPTEFGIRKILRNILALQQSVKSLVERDDETEFERAKEFYNLFFIGPQALLDSLRVKQTFTFEEYQSMLNLQCGVDPTVDSSGRAVDRNYSMYVIDLHGLVMDKADIK